MANVPSGNLSQEINVPWYNPFVFGATNYTISGTPNGNVPVYNLTSTGFGSRSHAGEAWQNDQYNGKREGFGA